MKLQCIFLLLFVTKTSLGSIVQKDSIQFIRIDYSMQLNFQGYETYKASLYIKNSGAIFIYKNTFQEPTQLNDKEDNQYSFNIRDTSEYRINSDNANVVEYVRGFSKKELFKVIEPLPVINWQISDDTAKIGSYICSKAICTFRGRTYTAWFTTQIATVFGPLKLHGLPGLILKLSDDTKEVIINVTAIHSNATEPPQISETQYKTITKTKYKEYLEKEIQDISKNISSKVGRGLKVEVKATSLKTIEID
jgi:GLPGLI family protein